MDDNEIPVEEETSALPTDYFLGEAEAILSVSDNADDGIRDLIDAYKENDWDDDAKALSIIEDYGNKLRQKAPGEAAVLTPQETLDIAPVKPGDVGNTIATWEEINTDIAEKGTDPFMRAYQGSIVDAIQKTATAGYQQANDSNVSQWSDKANRVLLGFAPGTRELIEDLGGPDFSVELERNLRADSNDTFASAVATGVGSLIGLPATPVELVARPLAFGMQAFGESREAGGSLMDASKAAGLEATSQLLDVITDKLLFLKAAKTVAPVGKKIAGVAAGEAATEYTQETISEAARVVGLNQDEFTSAFSKEKLYAAGAGGLVGATGAGVEARFPGALSGGRGFKLDGTGLATYAPDPAAATVVPADASTTAPATAPQSLAETIGISNPFPEVSPRRDIATIGEPVAGSANVTEMGDAGTGVPTGELNTVATSDAGEIFVGNPDGTTSRIVNGEQKQSHETAISIPAEVAANVASLQSSEIDGEPVVIKRDDVGRPYIDHPRVAPDLTLLPAGTTNSDPVVIPESDDGSGHVLQYSEKITPLGNNEHQTSISKGGVSTAGAMASAQITTIEKYRTTQALSPEVKHILDLDTDFSPLLTYVPSTNDKNMHRINEVFERFNNDALATADYLLSKYSDDVSDVEAVASSFAAERLSARAKELRGKQTEEDTNKADQYDALAAQLTMLYAQKGTEQAQGMQMRLLSPITGNSVIAHTRIQLNDLAFAKVAAQEGISVAQVENLAIEDKQLDVIERGLADREALIIKEEQEADARMNEPDPAIVNVDKEIDALDNATTPEIMEKEAEIKRIDEEQKILELKATEIEETAQQEADVILAALDTVDTKVEEVNGTVEEFTSRIKELTQQKKTLESKKDLIATEKKLLTPVARNPDILAAKERVAAAKTKEEKAKAKSELGKVEARVQADHVKQVKTLEDTLTALTNQITEVSSDLKETNKNLKEAKAEVKKGASATREADVARKKAEAQKILEAAKKEKAAMLAKNKAAKIAAAEELARLKKERDAANALRKEELKAKRKLIKDELKATLAARKALRATEKETTDKKKKTLAGDREKVRARRDRNKRILAALEGYKKEFSDKITPEIQERIDGLVDVAKTHTGIPQKEALEALSRLVGELKGIGPMPSGSLWSTFWQSNVLFNLGTQALNITGNAVLPPIVMATEAGKGRPTAGARFARAWAAAFIDHRTPKDIKAGFKGELPARRDVDTEETIKRELSSIADGTDIPVESDPVRGMSMQISNLIGTGKLTSLLSKAGLSLRSLGAADAVFRRMAQEGYLAMKAPSYDEYLKAKADGYENLLLQARTEKATLDKLGVKTTDNFEWKRADELAIARLPEERRVSSSLFASKAVFQSKKGPTGFLSSAMKQALNKVSSIGETPNKITPVNAQRAPSNPVNITSTAQVVYPQRTIAEALRLSNRVFRNDMSVMQVFSAVMEGVQQKKSMVINGQEYASNTSTKHILGAIVDAINNKQIVNLKGGSVSPLRYAVGMFVNTASQVLDLSVELLPVVGGIDKAAGQATGISAPMTQEEVADTYSRQLMATVIGGAMIGALLPGMDDEENQYVYVYGMFTDKALREYYKAKGIRPGMFRIGKTLFNYKDIPGLNLFMAGIGSLSDAMMVAKRTPERPITVGSALQSMAVGCLYAATQLTMLRNFGLLADLISGVNGETAKSNQIADIVSNIVSGYVPFSGAGRELDRFMYGDLKRPTDLAARMIQSIPLTRAFTDNQPALNILGEPVSTSTLPGIGRIFGTYKTSPEISWLLKNGYAVSAPKPGNKLTANQQAEYAQYRQSDDPDVFEAYLSDEEQTAYMKMFGPQLKALLAVYSRSYPVGFKPEVQNALTKEVNAIKSSVKDRIIRRQ